MLLTFPPHRCGGRIETICQNSPPMFLANAVMLTQCGEGSGQRHFQLVGIN
jgi:hypothetical protein